jgi:hypothetical protein
MVLKIVRNYATGWRSGAHSFIFHFSADENKIFLSLVLGSRSAVTIVLLFMMQYSFEGNRCFQLQEGLGQYHTEGPSFCQLA